MQIYGLYRETEFFLRSRRTEGTAMNEFECYVLLPNGEMKTLVTMANSPTDAIRHFAKMIPDGATPIGCRQILGRGTSESSIEWEEQP